LDVRYDNKATETLTSISFASSNFEGPVSVADIVSGTIFFFYSFFFFFCFLTTYSDDSLTSSSLFDSSSESEGVACLFFFSFFTFIALRLILMVFTAGLLLSESSESSYLSGVSPSSSEYSVI